MKRAFQHTVSAVPAGGEKRAPQRRLQDAAGAGDLAAVQALCKEGADPAALCDAPLATLRSTALHAAAGQGRLDVLSWFLDVAGLSADHRPKGLFTRHTALMSAATAGHAAAIQLLIDHGADANSADHRGMTALHIASEGGHRDAVRVLLAAGADPARRDVFGLRAQDIACNKPAAALAPRARTRLHGEILDLFFDARHADGKKPAAHDPAVLAADVSVPSLALKNPRRSGTSGGPAA